MMACIFVLLAIASPVAGQRLGTVWAPPRDAAAAQRTLRAIHRSGLAGLRLTNVPSEAVLQAADTLGLALFVDVAPAQWTDAVVRRLARHASVQAVGVTLADVAAQPAPCRALRQWAARAHAAGRDAYLVTPLRPAGRRCTASGIDRYLLDVRDLSDPVARWRAWQRAAQTPVALGAVGAWAAPNRTGGWRVPHTRAWQARYLERTLRAVTGTLPAETWVFVYRWSDRHPAFPGLLRRYGLHAASGVPHPGGRVLRGWARRQQTTFAFGARAAPTTDALAWVIIALGWVWIAGFGWLYARHASVPRMLERYFWTHGFFQDALQDRRVQVGAANGWWVVGMALAAGAFVAWTVHAVHLHRGVAWVLRGVAEPLQSSLVAWLQAPALVGLLAGGGVALSIVCWTALLAFVTRWGALRLGVGQALVATAWSLWPAALLLLAVLVLVQSPAASPLAFGAVAGSFVVAGVGGSLRAALDVHAVARPPGTLVAACCMLSPPVLWCAAAYAVLWHYGLSAEYVLTLLRFL
ncbi:hypothetical protein [Salisaeta longa]|uniref:hypothetical protein n=1 Tax=Salisaeta longa TaxID=503170 RepID=UPI0003B54D4D|nr:hypothetical protein [Salisaeta longa]